MSIGRGSRLSDGRGFRATAAIGASLLIMAAAGGTRAQWVRASSGTIYPKKTTDVVVIGATTGLPNRQLTIKNATNPAIGFGTGTIDRADLAADASGNFRIDVGGTQRILVDAAGNIAVNLGPNIAPTSKFDVNVGSTNGGRVRFAAQDGAYYYPSIETYKWTTGNYYYGSRLYQSDGGALYFENAPTATKIGAHAWQTRMVIAPNGRIGIGTTAPQSQLAVNGTITAKEVNITVSGWSDCVFDASYSLKPLKEVEAGIKRHKHLEDMPTAAEVTRDGVSLGEMQARLLKKTEELTLYLIDLQKQNDAIKVQNAALSARVAELEKAMKR